MEYSGYVWPCSAGETFDEIALMVYGNEKYAAELMSFNPEMAWVTFFQGGEKLRLPLFSPETTETPTAAPWKV